MDGRVQDHGSSKAKLAPDMENVNTISTLAEASYAVEADPIDPS
jgi:hypothetical protein